LTFGKEEDKHPEFNSMTITTAVKDEKRQYARAG